MPFALHFSILSKHYRLAYSGDIATPIRCRNHVLNNILLYASLGKTPNPNVEIGRDYVNLYKKLPSSII